MRGAVAEVLAGEYECGLHGQGLDVLDIGANVGSFSLWAHHRWPGSRIVAYEPHPGTFRMLETNVGGLAGVKLVNAAVYPTDGSTIEFVGRFDGDGEAGVADCMSRTFEPSESSDRFSVPALHPRDLPRADIVKLDVEGAEADILEHMDLSSVSLILLEYQTGANRAAIKAILRDRFELIGELEFDWAKIMYSGYRDHLRGDQYGHLFFLSRSNTKLTAHDISTDPAPPLLRRLRGHVRLRSRMRALLSLVAAGIPRDSNRG